MRRRKVLTAMTGGTVSLIAGCSGSREPESSGEGDNDEENNESDIEINASDEEMQIESPVVEVSASHEIEVEEGIGSDEIYAVGSVENIGETTADITVHFKVYEQDGEYDRPLFEYFEGVEPGEEREFRIGPALVDEENLEDTEVEASGVRVTN